MSLDDHVKALLAAGRESEAASEALRDLGPRTLRYLRSLLDDDDDAGDAFSLFAENFWRALPTFQFRSSLRTWAFRIAMNAAHDIRDSAWRRQGRRLATGEVSALADDIRTRTFERVSRQKTAVDKLRESLGEEERALLALRIDQELSWREIAEVMSVDGTPLSVDTLCKRFERIKARLTQMAREQGLV